jgi:hypothetical protein
MARNRNIRLQIVTGSGALLLIGIAWAWAVGRAV